MRTIVLLYKYNTAYFRTCQAEFQNLMYIRTFCDIITVLLKGGGDMRMADRLKELRKSRGITQAELATMTGLSFHAINSYESGRRTPNSKAMAVLERYFNVTGEYLRGESSERAPECAWEDAEIMAAIRESFPDQLLQLNDALKSCSAEEQQAVFTILVQLRSVLNLKDAAKRQTAISMIRNVAVDVEHLTSDGSTKEE